MKTTFLFKPYDHLLIRQNPIYREPYFVLERLNKDLSIDKEEITSKHIPEARCAEEFLIKLLEHPRMKTEAKISLRKASRPGWIRVEADKGTDIEEIWKLGMKKVATKEFFTINQ